MKKRDKLEIGIYGKIVLLKQYCERCRMNAFVIDGVLQCCGEIIEALDKNISKNYIVKSGKRDRSNSFISKATKSEVLKKQDNMCIYCDGVFGTCDIDMRNFRYRELKIHFDHYIPWSYNMDNELGNVVAACGVCNGIKSNKYFKTFDDARKHILERRDQKYDRERTGYNKETEGEGFYEIQDSQAL